MFTIKRQPEPERRPEPTEQPQETLCGEMGHLRLEESGACLLCGETPPAG